MKSTQESFRLSILAGQTLRLLDMRNCDSLIMSLHPFQSLRNLRSLKLKDVADYHFEGLAELRQLTHLSLEGLDRSSTCFPAFTNHFPNLENLQELKLNSFRLIKFADFTLQLTKLTLRNCKTSQTAMDSLRNLVQLRKLTLQNTLLPEGFDLHHFTDIPSLAHLSIDHWQLDKTPSETNQQQAHSLAPLINLVYLKMSNCKVTSEQLALMATLPNLAKLDLGNSEISGTCQTLQLLQRKCIVIPPKVAYSGCFSKIRNLCYKIWKFSKKAAKGVRNNFSLRTFIVALFADILHLVSLYRLRASLRFIVKKIVKNVQIFINKRASV